MHLKRHFPNLIVEIAQSKLRVSAAKRKQLTVDISRLERPEDLELRDPHFVEKSGSLCSGLSLPARHCMTSTLYSHQCGVNLNISDNAWWRRTETLNSRQGKGL